MADEPEIGRSRDPDGVPARPDDAARVRDPDGIPARPEATPQPDAVPDRPSRGGSSGAGALAGGGAAAGVAGGVALAADGDAAGAVSGLADAPSSPLTGATGLGDAAPSAELSIGDAAPGVSLEPDGLPAAPSADGLPTTTVSVDAPSADGLPVGATLDGEPDGMSSTIPSADGEAPITDIGSGSPPLSPSPAPGGYEAGGDAPSGLPASAGTRPVDGDLPVGSGAEGLPAAPRVDDAGGALGGIADDDDPRALGGGDSPGNALGGPSVLDDDGVSGTTVAVGAAAGVAVVGGAVVGGRALRNRGPVILPADGRALVAGEALDARDGDPLVRALADRIAAWLGEQSERVERRAEPVTLGEAPAATLTVFRAGAQTPALLVVVVPPRPTPATRDAWAEAGAAELWLVDPAARTVVRQVRVDDGWRVDETATGETRFAAATLDGLAFALADLWDAIE